MGFIDHLEELRWRLVKGFAAVIVATIGCAFFSDFIIEKILIAPIRVASPNAKLQNLVPYGQLSLYLQAVVFSAVIIAFPVIAYQIWQFVRPGLMPKERKASRFFVLFVSLCFFAGIAFGYFVFLPISLRFFASFGTALIENNIAIGDYVSFFLSTVFTAGLVFELPMLSYVLSKIGFLTPAFMRHYRRHSIVAIFLLSAIITPSTDMVTQAVIAVPMLLLYEVSIWISGAVQKRREQEEAL
ncbi:MAG: twin-arginine translocase subunit TatC [Rhizobacter sp.]|nr:twin-arginine translocase subunit TatC [Chlorobiales bacterium]